MRDVALSYWYGARILGPGGAGSKKCCLPRRGSVADGSVARAWRERERVSSPLHTCAARRRDEGHDEAARRDGAAHRAARQHKHRTSRPISPPDSPPLRPPIKPRALRPAETSTQPPHQSGARAAEPHAKAACLAVRPLSSCAPERITRARPCLFLHNPSDCASLETVGGGRLVISGHLAAPTALSTCNPQRPSEERGGQGSQPHARRSPHPHTHGGVRAGQAKPTPPQRPTTPPHGRSLGSAPVAPLP